MRYIISSASRNRIYHQEGCCYTRMMKADHLEGIFRKQYGKVQHRVT